MISSFRVHRNLPANRDPVESMAIEDCFSPLLHRINQAIRSRAIQPNSPIPPIPEVLEKLSHQPEGLQAASKDVLEGLISVADVKKGP